jgi:hypothetical protein
MDVNGREQKPESDGQHAALRRMYQDRKRQKPHEQQRHGQQQRKQRNKHTPNPKRLGKNDAPHTHLNQGKNEPDPQWRENQEQEP